MAELVRVSQSKSHDQQLSLLNINILLDLKMLFIIRNMQKSLFLTNKQQKNKKINKIYIHILQTKAVFLK